MKTVRLQFDVVEHVYKRLQEIRILDGSVSNVELFKRSVAVYEWFLKERAKGAEFQVVGPDGTVTKIIWPKF